ncbi:insulinase family protein [Rothia sp. AR01]|uniref:Insulinase family protein n=1 Tax=Rothia santali TaxID=2949643 RepID=A0A9X2KHL9_9MICC|nr:pitrilysin family protein [Rothia santali]MCP3425050.1 insulinase family protein [Rothia santali]
MPYDLSLDPQRLTEELDYRTGRLVYSGEGGNDVRRSVLPGGVRVVTERMPSQRSVALGFWVGVGSRDEEPGMLGSTHFLEHLLFKGTANRTALDIAEAFDAVGGESNALTAKEHTCYYARVLSEDVPMAVSVIADMVTSAVLEPAELEQERGVILEEIAMDLDDPTDVAFEEFTAQIMGRHPLGRPIGGTPAEITAVERDAVWEHYRRHYTPDRLVISAAGGLEHHELVELVLEALERAGWDLTEGVTPRPRRVRRPSPLAPEFGEHRVDRTFEQANVILGTTGLIAGHERRFAMSVLNAALGGGMSSRLFQEIRERRGLAYNTFSFAGSYSDAGYFGMYAGCTPEKVALVTDLMRAELDRMAAEEMLPTELAKVTGQLGGSTVMGSEDVGSRMSRLGRSELDTGHFTDLDELLASLRAVTAAEVRELAAELASRETVLTVVGA